MGNLEKILLISAVLFFHINCNLFPQQQRNPLIEFCTGTWCPWCACGDYTIENLLVTHPNLIPLAYHGGGGGDPFQNFLGNEIISLLQFSGYPTATVDRAGVPGDYTTWAGKVNSRINVPATVSIEIQGIFNPTTGQLVVRTDMTSLENSTGQYKYNIVLTEDSLIYNQANNGVCVTGGANWVHYWVVRAMMNGAPGEELNTGSTWNMGETISKTISYNVPLTYNQNRCSIVAFVYKQNSPLYLAQVQQAEKIPLSSFAENSISVISPNGGENLLAGSNYDITWMAENADSVEIKYTTDSGISWLPIIDAYFNSGSFMWEVPNTISSNCRIRISSVDNPLNYDESDNSFTIYQMQISVYTGWNMVSVPILSEDMSKSSLFPTATSPAYAYNNGYDIEDTLRNGVGYWLKFNSNEIIALQGSIVNQNAINVVNGWNMIGPFDKTIIVDSITTLPSNLLISPFYGFGAGYYTAITLEPGNSYWIKTNANGIIQLNSD